MKIERVEMYVKEKRPRWFSQKCCKCENRYVREPMWVKYVDGGYKSGWYYVWICKHCAPTIEDAEKMVV